MEQTNMVLSAFQTMAAQGMIPKTGKAGDKAAGNFQKLLDQKAQSSAPKKDASVEQKPKTDAVNKEEAPIQEESALEKAKKLAEQGYAIVQFNVGCVQIDPETGEVIAEYEPKEYLLAFNGTDHEIIPIGNMPAWERAQLDQLVSDFKTIDVSDPEADAMLEATDPNAKYTVAELLEKYGNEQMGKVSGQAVEEINPQQKEGEKVEIVDVDQGPQQLFHDVEAAPIKVGETYTEQPVDEANVVGQVDAQLAQALQTGETMVRIQLTPENLGEVTVEITQSSDGALRIALSAHNDSTRGLLERHASDLQGMLASRTNQNVEVNVQRQAESQQNQNQQHNYDGHNGHAQDGQERRRQQREHTSPEDFMQQLRLGLISDDGF